MSLRGDYRFSNTVKTLYGIAFVFCSASLKNKPLKNILLTFIFLSIVCLNPTKGCDCTWGGGLVKNAQESSLTFHGKVTQLKTFRVIHGDTVSTSIEVEILTKIKGDEDRKVITIWGDRGADCRPYLYGIQVGSEWIFSLHQIQNNEYAVSNCGEHLTPVSENKTWGYIIYNDRCSIQKPVIMSIDSLKLAIENPSEFMYPTKSCVDTQYFVDANQLPRVSRDKTIIEFLKGELDIKEDINKRYEDKIIIEVFISKVGIVERINFSERWYYSKKMKRKHGYEIIRILKESSPWIPGEHRGEKIPMKLVLHIKDY